MTPETISAVLEKHGKWLKGEEGGVRARLIEADLRGAHLPRANFERADLRGADLTGCHLPSANFTGADLRMAHLSRCHLPGANFAGADLRGANLSGANLARANFARENGTYISDVLPAMLTAGEGER